MADASDFATFSKNDSLHPKTQLSYAFAKLLGGKLRAIALTTARRAIERRPATCLHGMSDHKRDNAIFGAIFGAIVNVILHAIGGYAVAIVGAKKS